MAEFRYSNQEDLSTRIHAFLENLPFELRAQARQLMLDIAVQSESDTFRYNAVREQMSTGASYRPECQREIDSIRDRLGALQFVLRR